MIQVPIKIIIVLVMVEEIIIFRHSMIVYLLLLRSLTQLTRDLVSIEILRILMIKEAQSLKNKIPTLMGTKTRNKNG